MSTGSEYAILRQAMPDDLPFLKAMCYLASIPKGGGYASEQEYETMSVSFPWVREYVEGWGREGDFGLIATDEAGAPLGAAWYRHYEAKNSGTPVPQYELSVAVVPAAQRRKIGQNLVKGLLEHAEAEGIDELGLQVSETNIPAEMLYEKLGFVPVAKTTDSYDVMATFLNAETRPAFVDKYLPGLLLPAPGETDPNSSLKRIGHDILTPVKAQNLLGSYGYKRDDWEKVLNDRSDRHATRAEIVTALGDRPRSQHVLHLNLRMLDELDGLSHPDEPKSRNNYTNVEIHTPALRERLGQVK